MQSSKTHLIRNDLRKKFRTQRQKLSSAEQQDAKQQVCQQLRSEPLFVSARHIAAYWPDDGEISPENIIDTAWAMGKKVYLPTIDLHDQIKFLPFCPDDKLTPGKFGILQPAGKKPSIHTIALDLVLTPLVAFDANGNRLGRGGGFYDQLLAGLKYSSRSKSPQRHREPFAMGLAHSCQQTDSIPAQSWDIKLDAVATEKSILFFNL